MSLQEQARKKTVRRTGFIERTLVDINANLEQTVFAERIARQPGLLQSLDPRLKLVTTLLLILAVSLSHSLAILAGLYALALALAVASGVPAGFFIKRVWLLIPFFTGIVALPALFITPGPALLQLPLGIIVTRTGAQTALFLLMRVGTSVSMAILLVLCTPWNTLLKALGVLRLPDVIVLILEMTYRYIHLLLHTASDMYLSRKSRLIRRQGGAEQRRIVSANAAVLLGKSLQVSHDVYLSMQSRGFRGYPRTLDQFRMRLRDYVYGAAILVLASAAIWLGR
jgi:cobalt/nickel transport system permease protein